jgi:hypothetical protein
LDPKKEVAEPEAAEEEAFGFSFCFCKICGVFCFLGFWDLEPTFLFPIPKYYNSLLLLLLLLFLASLVID